MRLIHLAAAILATIRLTELVTEDRIAVALRTRWPQFWSCRRCVSVWAGIAATLAYVYTPWLNWPFALSSLALLYPLAMLRLQPGHGIAGKGLVIDVDERGQLKILRCDFDLAETMGILSAVMRLQARQGKPNGETLNRPG